MQWLRLANTLISCISTHSTLVFSLISSFLNLILAFFFFKIPGSQQEIHKICAYLQSNDKCFESMGTSTNNSKTAQSLCSMVAKRLN